MGEDNINRMIRDLYAELERSAIRGLFPENMDLSAEKSDAEYSTFDKVKRRQSSYETNDETDHYP